MIPEEELDVPSQDTPPRERQLFSPFARHTLVIVCIVAIALFLWQIVHALLLTFAGVLLAVFLHGCATRLRTHIPLSAPWALVVVGFGLLIVLGAFVWLVGPQVADQFTELTQRLPYAVDQLKHYLQRYPWGQYMLQHVTASKSGLSLGMDVFSRITGVASTVFAVLTDLLLILFAGIFFAANPDVYRRGLLLLIPQRQEARVGKALDTTGQALWRWLLGRLVAMLFVGAFVTGGLLLIGVPIAFALGLIAGLLDFVSLVGPVVAAFPGILLALTLSPTTALYTVLVYFLAQQIEGYIVTPLIQQEAVSLPPGLVILAVVAFGLLFGVSGIVLATPLAIVGMVLIKMLYVEDVLGKHM